MGGAYTKPVELKTKYFNNLVAKDLKNDFTKEHVVAITGTTSGTGFIAARTLAQLGATVVLLNRKSSRSEASLAKLKELVPDGTFEAVECDLQSLDSVRAACEHLKSKYADTGIAVLANNAGVMALPDYCTKDGYEVQMQTNVISHFMLAKELFPLLDTASKKFGEARIVNHSSIARYGQDLKAKYFEKYAPESTGNLGGDASRCGFLGPRWERYQQTKLGDAVFTYALADKLADSNSSVKAAVCHPGLAATNLQVTTAQTGGMGGRVTNWFMRMGQSQEDGAAGLVRCIAGKNVENGSFYGPSGGRTALKGYPVKLNPESSLLKSANKNLLWEMCEKACGEFKL